MRKLRVQHTNADSWEGSYVRVFLDDGTFITCYPNPTVYIEGTGAAYWKSSILLVDRQYADVPCY
jgi:hypothetical protein